MNGEIQHGIISAAPSSSQTLEQTLLFNNPNNRAYITTVGFNVTTFILEAEGKNAESSLVKRMRPQQPQLQPI